MDHYYLELDEKSLRRIAKVHFGACDDGSRHPDDLEWALEPELPLEQLLICIAGNNDDPNPSCLKQKWESWFRHECDDVPEELHGKRNWEKLAKENIKDPVIISIDGAKVQVWDGWHRIGGSFAAGRTTIPAIIGRPRDQK